MNNPHFNLTNLAVSDLQCTDRTVPNGQTLSGKWGYVWKVSDIDLTARIALIDLLHDGVLIKSMTMQSGDISEISNPSNPEEKQRVTLQYVQGGRELQACFFKDCTWTKQYSKIVMLLDLPSSVTDGQSYTVSGRITKDRLNESLETPIVNEKVYITESGSIISESMTDSNGIFNLRFTYHTNNNYEVHYPGTVDVTPFYYTLNMIITPGASHVLTYTFRRDVPDSAITAFNTITNPISEINKVLVEQGTIGNLVGWELKNVQINKRQIIVHLRDTSIQTANIRNFNNINNINKLGLLEDVISVIGPIIVAAVIGAIIGALIATVGIGVIAGVIIGTLYVLVNSWDAVLRTIDFVKSVISSKEPTNDAPDADINKNIKTLDEDCKKKYDICISNGEDAKTCCLDYCNCVLDNGYVMIAGAKVYLYPDARIELRDLAEQLKKDAKNECISKLENNLLTCDEALECIKKRVSDAMISSSNIVHNYYPPNDKYVAPWEKDEDDLGNILKNVLIIGGLITVGYIGYKVVSKKN